jgi:hypothetical protein
MTHYRLRWSYLHSIDTEPVTLSRHRKLGTISRGLGPTGPGSDHHCDPPVALDLIRLGGSEGSMSQVTLGGCHGYETVMTPVTSRVPARADDTGSSQSP